MVILLASGELVKDWPEGGEEEAIGGEPDASLPSSGGTTTGTYATTAQCLVADK